MPSSSIKPIGSQTVKSTFLIPTTKTEEKLDFVKGFENIRISERPSTSSIETLTKTIDPALSDLQSLSDKSSGINEPSKVHFFLITFNYTFDILFTKN